MLQFHLLDDQGQVENLHQPGSRIQTKFAQIMNNERSRS